MIEQSELRCVSYCVYDLLCAAKASCSALYTSFVLAASLLYCFDDSM